MTTTNDDTRPHDVDVAPVPASGPEDTVEVVGTPRDAQDAADDGAYGDETASEEFAYGPEPDERSVVRIPRGLFVTMTALAALLIIGLATSTVLLARRDRTGNDAVVATVDGEPIRRAEYDRAVASGAGEQILDGLVTEKLVLAEAKRRGITVDDGKSAALLDEQKQAFDSDEEYQAALRQAGLTEDDLRKRLRLTELLRQMVSDKTQVSDEEISGAYTNLRDRYQGQTLDQARDRIREDLQRQKANTAIPALLEQLKVNAKIETHLPGKQT